MSDLAQLTAYRVVQEATTNCVRHADAKTIQIRVSVERDQLGVLVSDDGLGLDPRQWRRGLGLRGIDERVKELNGLMTISSAPGGGTTLRVSLPLPVLSPPAELDVPLARAAG